MPPGGYRERGRGLTTRPVVAERFSEYVTQQPEQSRAAVEPQATGYLANLFNGVTSSLSNVLDYGIDRASAYGRSEIADSFTERESPQRQNLRAPSERTYNPPPAAAGLGTGAALAVGGGVLLLVVLLARR